MTKGPAFATCVPGLYRRAQEFDENDLDPEKVRAVKYVMRNYEDILFARQNKFVKRGVREHIQKLKENLREVRFSPF